jgi:hypothetical protein
MGTIVVYSDLRHMEIMERALHELSYPRVKMIMHYALDQVGHKIAGEIVSKLVEQTGLSKNTVKSEIHEIKSSPDNLEFIIEGEGHRWGLNKYNPTQTSGGAFAKPWNTPRLFPGTFMLERYGYQVFKRLGSGRGPIKMLYGAGVPREMERGMVVAAYDEAAKRTVPEAIEKKLEQYLPK